MLAGARVLALEALELAREDRDRALVNAAQSSPRTQPPSTAIAAPVM